MSNRRGPYTERGNTVANALKEPLSQKPGAKWPLRGRPDDVQQVHRGTVAVIDLNRHNRHEDEGYSGSTFMITDASTRGANDPTHQDFLNHTKFGGVVSENAFHPLHTSYSVMRTGSTSVWCLGPKDINVGQRVMYTLPMNDNPMAFVNDPNHPDLTLTDQFSQRTGIPKGSQPFWVQPFDPTMAVTVDRVYNSGVKEGSTKSNLYRAEEARDRAVLAAGLITLAERGFIQLNGTMEGPNPDFARNFRQQFMRDGEQTEQYVDLLANIQDGLNSDSRRRWRIGGQTIAQHIQRIKFAKRPRDKLLSKASERMPRARKIQQEYGNAMPRYYAQFGMEMENAYGRIIGTAMESAKRGERFAIALGQK